MCQVWKTPPVARIARIMADADSVPFLRGHPSTQQAKRESTSLLRVRTPGRAGPAGGLFVQPPSRLPLRLARSSHPGLGCNLCRGCHLGNGVVGMRGPGGTKRARSVLFVRPRPRWASTRRGRPARATTPRPRRHAGWERSTCRMGPVRSRALRGRGRGGWSRKHRNKFQRTNLSLPLIFFQIDILWCRTIATKD